MSSKNFLVGVFDDEDVVLHAVEHIRHSGVKIFEVFTPFPIHGMEDALGVKRSMISRAAFFFGMTGTICAITMISFMMHFDWPMNVGGKSTLPAPSFIPVTFELTVLFAAFGMVGTFLVISNLLPGAKNLLLDPRSTDDKFIVGVELDKNHKSYDEIAEIMKAQGATEVYKKEIVE